MTIAPARLRSRAARAVLLAAVVTASGCGSSDGGGTATPTTASPSPSTTTAAQPSLPPAEEVGSLGGQTFTARSFPDFALTVGDVVWISGIEPGIVGYDAGTGKQQASVPTKDVYLAMEAGHGALWAAEASDGQYPDTLLRIDPVTGAVAFRAAAPEPGLKPESSLAVTDTAVWGIVGDFGTPDDRRLTSFDPRTGEVLEIVPAPEAANSVRGGFGSLWVSTSQRTVVRIDPADGTEQAVIETGSGSGFLTVTEDAVWVLNGGDGTVSRIDPETDEVVATVQVSEGSISGGDIVGDDGSVWARTAKELAVEVDPATNEVVRVLGPAAGSGSVALAEGALWITAHDTFEVHRVPMD